MGLERVLRPFRIVIRSVFDLLVADLCLLCHTPHDPDVDVEDTQPGHSGLTRPVSVRIVPGLVVQNHPICRRCLARFDVTESVGCLGSFEDGGHVRLGSGERFSAAYANGFHGHRLSGPIRVFAPFMTDDNVLSLVHWIKFRGYEGLVGPVAAAMAESCDPTTTGPKRPILVPVPARSDDGRPHAAGSLARELGHLWDLTVCGEGLVRLRPFPRQSQTPRENRASNVRGAFGAGEAAELEGRTVLLVDDLVTSGATAASCTAALAGAGATSVDVVCFGRAL